jgi:tetratricopeptide (TPR) repeat protein
MRHFCIFALLFATIAACVTAAVAQPLPDDVARIRDAWADLKYRHEGDPQRLAKSKALEGDAAAAVQSHPDSAAALFWQANVLCLTADIMHSMASLGPVHQAEQLLEKAAKLDPKSSDIEAMIGTIYHEVPGWPISFGSNGKATAHLRRALDLDPDGVDANYYMGDFQLSGGHVADAVQYYEKALAAVNAMPPSVAQQGRRQEIEKSLADARRRADRKGG